MKRIYYDTGGLWPPRPSVTTAEVPLMPRLQEVEYG